MLKMKKLYLRSVLLVFILTLVTAVSTAQFVVGTQTIGTGTNQLDITVSVDSSFNKVKFEITGPATAWFGFSFNTQSMSPGSYTILANVNGSNPAEYVMVQHAAPTLQPTQNLQNITTSTASGRKTYVFYRDRVTSDASDYVFSYTTNSLDIAWGYGTGLALAYHDSRGGSSIAFSNPCTTVPPVTLSPLTICAGDSIQIFGQYRKVNGTYSTVFPKLLECDSVVIQSLVVMQPIVNTLPLLSICQGDSVLIFGQHRKSSGTWHDTLSTIHSCDSIVIQSLVVGSNVVNHLPQISICNGDSALIFGVYQKISGIFSDTVSTSTQCDSVLIQELLVHPAIFDTLPDLSICFNDSVQIFGNWVSIAGTYQVTLSSSVQCDSTVVQRLLVITVDTTVNFVSGSGLTAVSGYDSYQWIDCQTGNPVPGAISSVFLPVSSGIYKVVIGKDSCLVESGCHQVIIESVNSHKLSSVRMQANPNPAKTIVRINLLNQSGRAKIQLLDITGKILTERNILPSETTHIIDVQAYQSGVYFLRYSSAEEVVTQKLIIGSGE